ncbi:MAG: PolA [uncultured Rubrobacteraceae bacterium]|uniref:DNA polymerase I n=1 Tax=uncultured Rubrobacteraceae bacterium TaxID=349277 RepID=A0A6J4SS66_9ACTN|nr:MAG: PolA [uncultured Rubrobacteraceae bacterium]
MEEKTTAYTLVTDPDDLPGIATALEAAEAVGTDTETTSLSPRDGRARLLQLALPEQTFVVDLFEVGDISPLKGALEEGPVKVFHNAKFDYAFLKELHGISVAPVFDTMLAAQVLDGGRQGTAYGLDAVAERYLDEAPDKSEQRSDWSRELTARQLEYAARDAAVLLPLREKLLEALEAEDLVRVSKIEFAAVSSIAEMELAGVKLDVGRWKELEKTVRKRRDEAAVALEAHFPEPEGVLPLEGLGPRLNLNSPQQITDAFRSIGVELADTKVWTLLKVDHPAAKDLLRYRELQKKLGTYLETYPKFIHPKTGRIHASFLQCRVPTGRLACIAEGSPVDAPRDLLRYPTGIPIEKLREGDYVYSFDSDGIPKPRRILRTLRQGRKKVLKLVWRGGANTSYLGEMKATPDHLVRLASGAYKRMDELQPGDKLTWMRRSVSDDYAWLRWAGMESITVREHKHLVRGETVHHKDGNKLNNSPDNLEGMPRGEHSKLHPRPPVFKDCPYSEEELASMLSRGIARAAKIYPHDYNTLRRWASLYGIEVADMRRRRFHHVENHHVVAVLDEGEEVETYDLSIEGTPNFVVNEVCVHNCANPNIQQIPHEEEFRRCFVAEEGHTFVIADYSQIELRILAEVSGDPAFVEAFRKGEDLHSLTAATMYGVPMEEVTKDQRSDAKRINFGLMYGRGAKSLSAQLGTDEARGRQLIDEYFANYPKVQRFLQRTANRATRDRTLRTLAGRVRKFGNDPVEDDRGAMRREAMNYPIQGCVLGATRVFEKSRGYVPIRSLAGQAVSVWDGGRFSGATVVPSGKKRLVQVLLKGGHRIECSPDHKFLVRHNNGGEAWKTAGEIRSQERVVLADRMGKWELDLCLTPASPGRAWNANTADLNEIGTREELGEWLGRVASDGGVSERQINLLVAEHEEVLLPKLLSLTRRLGHVTHRTRVTEHQPQRLHHLTLSCTGLALQMKDMRIKERIPDVAWRSRSVLCGYLRGLFDGDGTVHPDGPVLTFGRGGKHIEWAREVQEALLLLGIRSRIGIYETRVNVRVMKKDVPLFCSEVGFMNPIKQGKAEAVVASSYKGKGGGSDAYGRAQKVESIQVMDEWVEMYDVVNSETERFAANGVVTHNSSADIAKLALAYMRRDLEGLDARLVNSIHDEFVVECREDLADEVSEKMRGAMTRAGERILEKVPVEVEVTVSREWTK